MSFSSISCYAVIGSTLFKSIRCFVGPQSDELKDLVEDKEIAACAVAFVVNGTRKGIVPLCADVASLMRSKRRCSIMKAYYCYL